MTPRAPGDRVYRTLARIVDEPFLRSAIEPTIADLQFELSRPRFAFWRRWLAYVRCAIAICRLLIGCQTWRVNVGRIAAVLLLGGGGAAALAWAQSTGVSGPLGLTPFFLVAVLAAITLRMLKLGRSYWEMFLNCVGISLLMSLGLSSFYVRMTEVPLWVAGRAVVMFLVCFGLGSALVAAVAWKPRGGTSGFQRRLLALVIGLGVFGVTSLAIRLLAVTSSMGAVAILSASVFMAFVFALVSSISLLPALALVRLFLRRRWALALVAAILSPLPALIIDIGGSGWRWRLMSMIFSGDDVLRAAAIFSPFILASAAVGWAMAEPRRAVESRGPSENWPQAPGR